MVTGIALFAFASALSGLLVGFIVNSSYGVITVITQSSVWLESCTPLGVSSNAQYQGTPRSPSPVFAAVS